MTLFDSYIYTRTLYLGASIFDETVSMVLLIFVFELLFYFLTVY